MFKRTHRPHLLRPIVVGCCLALVSTLLLFSSKASAQSAKTLEDPLYLQVNAGFGAGYRDGAWIPIQISLRNTGPDFNGKVSITAPSLSNTGLDSKRPDSYYQEPINLPTGAQKQVLMYIPMNTGIQGNTQNIRVDLLDNNDHAVQQRQVSLRSLNTMDIFVGILSNQSTGFGTLTQVTLPNPASRVITEPLTAKTLPNKTEALKNFDLLLLDNFTTSDLSKEQLAALQSWVNQGGKLILIGGPEWQRTLSTLPASLLPVKISGTGNLPPRTTLLPVGVAKGNGAETDSLPSEIPVSIGSATPGSTVILDSTTAPLFIQADRGQGEIYYLAYDPSLNPVANWSAASTLWKGIIYRSMGDQVLSLAQSQVTSKFTGGNGAISQLLQAFFPNIIPSIWTILVLLLSYVLVLGPIRLVLVRLSKNRDWSWRITLVTILVFSLLGYGMATLQKGNSILSSSLSIVQLDQGENGTTNSYITNYVSLFVPSQGDFTLRIPGTGLVHRATDPSRSNSQSSSPAIISSLPNETQINLPGVDIWTQHTIISQEQRQLVGGLTSHLSFSNNKLSGTVTNNLPYDLTDVYLLTNTGYVSLGRLAHGQTQSTQIILNNTTNTNPQMSIADQIASAKGLSVPFSPYNNNQLISPEQRHAAMLSAISNEGNNCDYGPCYQVGVAQPLNGQAVIANGQVVASNKAFLSSGMPPTVSGRDPLLIAGTPVTLVGWLDQADLTGKITINNASSPSVKEALVQAPLPVDFTKTVGATSVQLQGQLISIQNQNTNIQLQAHNIYSMSAGSMTFEFTLPAISKLEPKTITINEDPNVLQNFGNNIPGVGPAIDANHLQATLYNWQAQKWETFSFNQFSFVTTQPQPYIGPGGRIVLQLSNTDSTQGPILFTRPILSLQGSVGQ